METVLSNWTESMRLKSEKQKKRRAFNVMKDKAYIHKQARWIRSELICRKLQDKFKILLAQRQTRR